MPIVMLLLAASLPHRGMAAESQPFATARDTATLISDRDTVAAGQPLTVALRLRLASGWHTYWRNPGDAGVAPAIEWTLPPGVTAGDIAWPAPARMEEGPLTTYGYTGEVVLPVALTGISADNVAVTAHATWLVCKDICVPEEATFRLDLPAGTPSPSTEAPPPSAEAPLFARARALAPTALPWHATIAPDATLDVSGPEIGPRAIHSASFIPSQWGTVEGPGAPARIAAGRLSIALKPGSDFKPAANLGGVLTIEDATGQVSHYTVDATPGPASAGAGDGISLAKAVWFAMLGGLILNLMPCVFPILAMKALALARLSNGTLHDSERRHAALHGLSYTAGVMATFVALAIVVIAARALGGISGWGFQFQSPAFVAGMAWLMLAVGLNLSGVYTVGARVAGVGGSLATRHGYAGSFFIGLLAVLVATPCTAPYMAVAIGATLAAPPPVTIAVFLALGFGMALPFLVVTIVPALWRFMPRPGAWMETLRQLLAFPMYGAAVWLLWIMSQEAGPTGVLLTASGAIAVAFAAWALGLAERSGRGRGVAFAATIAAAIAGAAVLAAIATQPPPMEAAAVDPGTEKFSATRLAALQGEGRPVFVDMTAAWCVSCLVNERVALSRTEVRQAFADRNIVYLKGDWTRQDPDISAFLRAHGRDGVPLYVFYPAGNKPPEILPQVLTPGGVLSVIGAG